MADSPRSMIEFTPIASLLGGILIGLAAALLLVANGRVAGISGIACGVLRPRDSHETLWRLAFLAGMIGCGAVLAMLWPTAFSFELLRSKWSMVAAGLLVGLGTRIGNGCTSGHGVCGVSRLSPRSLVATTTFMLVGMATVFVIRRFFGGAL